MDLPSEQNPFTWLSGSLSLSPQEGLVEAGGATESSASVAGVLAVAVAAPVCSDPVVSSPASWLSGEHPRPAAVCSMASSAVAAGSSQAVNVVVPDSAVAVSCTAAGRWRGGIRAGCSDDVDSSAGDRGVDAASVHGSPRCTGVAMSSASSVSEFVEPSSTGGLMHPVSAALRPADGVAHAVDGLACVAGGPSRDGSRPSGALWVSSSAGDAALPGIAQRQSVAPRPPNCPPPSYTITDWSSWLSPLMPLQTFYEEHFLLYIKPVGCIPMYACFPSGYLRGCVKYLCDCRKDPSTVCVAEPLLTGGRGDTPIAFAQYLRHASMLNAYNWLLCLSLSPRVAHILYDCETSGRYGDAHSWYGNFLQDIVNQAKWWWIKQADIHTTEYARLYFDLRGSPVQRRYYYLCDEHIADCSRRCFRALCPAGQDSCGKFHRRVDHSSPPGSPAVGSMITALDAMYHARWLHFGAVMGLT